jgi:iron complex transport system ATP-binding protein
MTNMRADKLSFSYASRLVLDNISLELAAGEVLILLGANGAGKTTLLHALSRQLVPSLGTVVVDGQDLATLSRRSIAKLISLMPQHENRTTPLRVIDVVRMGRTPHCGWWRPLSSEDATVVGQSLDAAGMTSLSDRIVTQLSGGEWRRMILARALAQASPILLLDEPTAGLDLKYQFDVLDRVRRMARQRNLVVVMTLHDLNLASIFGDRLALLSDHRIVAMGKPHEVLTPSLVEQVFGVRSTVIEHPVHGTPLVITLGASNGSASQERIEAREQLDE